MRLLEQANGVTQKLHYDELTDKITITTEQDLSAFLDRQRAMRNNEDYSRKGIKEEFWHYASIPNVVIAELKAKGIDVFNKDHMKRVLAEINANYPYLKATDKKHA